MSGISDQILFGLCGYTSTAEDLIRNRSLAVNEIQAMMVEALADFPIVIDSQVKTSTYRLAI